MPKSNQRKKKTFNQCHQIQSTQHFHPTSGEAAARSPDTTSTPKKIINSQSNSSTNLISTLLSGLEDAKVPLSPYIINHRGKSSPPHPSNLRLSPSHLQNPNLDIFPAQGNSAPPLEMKSNKHTPQHPLRKWAHEEKMVSCLISSTTQDTTTLLQNPHSHKPSLRSQPVHGGEPQDKALPRKNPFAPDKPPPRHNILISVNPSKVGRRDGEIPLGQGSFPSLLFREPSKALVKFRTFINAFHTHDPFTSLHSHILSFFKYLPCTHFTHNLSCFCSTAQRILHNRSLFHSSSL
ncbi:hypothetical protein Dimus_038272 [Dionaea muscipula]